MNLLLPKSTGEFGSTDYWNKFFRARGKKAFEWYGEYPELCGHLHKYIKSKEDILMVGCGNSKLSADLYDVGYKNITNVDISSVVIQQMQNANRERKDMTWKQADITGLTDFAADSFNVVLDKGTLDALLTDESEEVLTKVRKYFDEITRVLRIGGRFVCISLLQPHILKLILSYFPNEHYMFRIVRCIEAENKTVENSTDGTSMPVFMVIASKFKCLPQKILEICLAGDKIQRLSEEDQVTEAINSVQQSAMVTNGLARNNPAAIEDEIILELHDPSTGNQYPRYTIHVLNQKPKKGNSKFAAFIVPQGREMEWLFSTSDGRKKLQFNTAYDRLAIVSMHREHNYPEWNKVQEELANYIKTLVPHGLTSQIPYLSLDSHVGHRELICKGSTELSGKYVIEDVLSDKNKTFRRLIFMNNQFTIQSEALLCLKYSKDGTIMEKTIDKTFLACQHHLYMTIGLNTTTSKGKSTERGEAILIGLGGGGLVTFIQQALRNVKITAVEIDSAIPTIATEFFGLDTKKHLEIIIMDGIEYLKQEAISNIRPRIDAVLFDVDSKDHTIGMSCPPKAFLEKDVLDAVKILIGSKGIFILNLVCRDEKLRENVFEILKVHFNSICSYKLDEDLNEIIYCKNMEVPLTSDEWEKSLKKSAKELNSLARRSKISDEELVEVEQFIENLKI